jgi:hypothetical protein
MSESETSKQPLETDGPHSEASGLPPCLPIGEMLKQMAAGCDCRPGDFTASCCEGSPARSATPAQGPVGGAR